MRIVRGMLLKAVGWNEIAPEIWPMELFAVVVIAFATMVYRETLDRGRADCARTEMLKSSSNERPRIEPKAEE